MSIRLKLLTLMVLSTLALISCGRQTPLESQVEQLSRRIAALEARPTPTPSPQLTELVKEVNEVKAAIAKESTEQQEKTEELASKTQWLEDVLRKVWPKESPEAAASPTPTPTPKAQKAPATQLKIVSPYKLAVKSVRYTWQGDFLLFQGEVVNEDTKLLKPVQLIVTVKNNRKEVIGSAVGRPALTALMANESAPFSIKVIGVSREEFAGGYYSIHATITKQ